jgi:hypothetical protein
MRAAMTMMPWSWMPWSWRGCLAVPLLLLSAAIPARAQTPASGSPVPTSGKAVADPKCAANVDARKLVDEGYDLRAQEKNKEAFEKLWCAHHTIKSYDLLGNLGLIELELGKYPAAANHMAMSLRSWPNLKDPKKRERYRQLEEQLNLAKLRALEIAVEVNRDGATVAIDGEIIGISPLPGPHYVAPGDHEVTAHIKDLPTATRKVRGKAGGSERVQLSIDAAAAPALPGPGPKTDRPTESDASRPSPADSPPKPAAAGSGSPVHGAWYAPPFAIVVTGVGVALGMHARFERASSDLFHLDYLLWKSDGPGVSPCVSPTGANVTNCNVALEARKASFERANLATSGLVIAGVGALAAGGLSLADCLRDKARGTRIRSCWSLLPAGIAAASFAAAIGLQRRAVSLDGEVHRTHQAMLFRAGIALCSDPQNSESCATSSRLISEYGRYEDAMLGMVAIGGIATAVTGVLVGLSRAPARGDERRAGTDLLLSPSLGGMGLAGVW